MSRWRLTTHDDAGRAKLLLSEEGKPLGFASLSWTSYRQLMSALLGRVTKEIRVAVEQYLHEKIWLDAERHFGNSEVAKAKLLEFGWSEAKIREYASEISRLLLDKFASFLPEHRA